MKTLARMSVIFVLSAAALEALAAEGRIPVFAPGVLGATGKYILTQDITGPATSSAIVIGAPNVDLDLNGFTVTEPGGAFSAIEIAVPIVEVTIHDGTVSSGNFGINAPLAGGGEKIVIEDVKVQAPTGPGIRIFDIKDTAIRRAVVDAPGAACVLIDGPGAHTGTIEDGIFRDCSADGVAISNATSFGIRNNRIQRTGTNGIVLDTATGSLVSENTVQSAGNTGIEIRASAGIKVYDNVIRGAGWHGIHLDPGSGDALVVMNTATSCGFAFPGGHGIFVEGKQSLLDRNQVNANSGFGLRFAATSGNNTFGRNMARGNAGGAPGPCAGAPPLFPPNSCNDGVANTSFGDNLIPGPPVF